MAQYHIAPYYTDMSAPSYGRGRVPKSMVRQFYENAMSGYRGGTSVEGHASTFRAVSEGVVAGGILGALHAEVGLDFKKVPIDGVLGFLAAFAGSRMENNGSQAGNDVKNIGIASLTILGFRKGNALAAEMKLKRGGKPIGAVKAGGTFAGDEMGSDFGAEDPIIAAARAL